MTREETKKIIMIMVASFPTYKPVDYEITINLWTEMFADTDYNLVSMALKSYIATDSSGFAPAIGKLKEIISTLTKPNEITEMEAWGMVSNAIRNSSYNSKAEFDKLPKTVQRAVGSPDVLRAWAIDEHYNENVAQSHFIRCFNNVAEREHKMELLPTNVRILIEQTMQKMIGSN